MPANIQYDRRRHSKVSTLLKLVIRAVIHADATSTFPEAELTGKEGCDGGDDKGDDHLRADGSPV